MHYNETLHLALNFCLRRSPGSGRKNRAGPGLWIRQQKRPHPLITSPMCSANATTRVMHVTRYSVRNLWRQFLRCWHDSSCEHRI